MLKYKISDKNGKFNDKMLVITSGGFPVRLKLKKGNDFIASIDREKGTIDISFDENDINCSYYSIPEYGKNSINKIKEMDVFDIIFPDTIKTIYLSAPIYSCCVDFEKAIVKVDYWKVNKLERSVYTGIPEEVFSGKIFKMTLKEGGKVTIKV